MTLGLPAQNGVSKSYPYIISASHALDTCATTVGDNLTFEHIFSLTWASRETHNLQRVFRPGGGDSPLYRLYSYVPRQRVCLF